MEPSALACLRPLRLAGVDSPTEQAGQPSAADEEGWNQPPQSQNTSVTEEERAKLIGRCWRSHHKRNQLERERAAKVIQRYWRAHLARKLIKNEENVKPKLETVIGVLQITPEVTESAQEAILNEDERAKLIGRCWRSHHRRNLLEQERAARVIQRYWRAHTRSGKFRPDEAKLALNQWASIASSYFRRSMEPSALAWLRPLRLAGVGSPTEQAGQPSAAHELEDTQGSEEDEWYDDEWNRDEYTQYDMDGTSWADDDSGDLELELAELHRAAEEEGWNQPPPVMAEERWIVWCGRLKKNCWSDTPVEDDGYWDNEGIWVPYDTKTKIKKARKVAKKGRRR